MSCTRCDRTIQDAVFLKCCNRHVCRECIRFMIKQYGCVICGRCDVAFNGNMNVLFKCPSDGKTYLAVGPCNATVEQLKHKVEEKIAIAAPQQRIIYAGKALADEHYLMEYNIVDGCSVHVVLALRGD